MPPIFGRDWFNFRSLPLDPPADLKYGQLDRMDGRRPVLAPVSHIGSYDYARDVMYADLERAGLKVASGRHKAVSA